MRWDARTKVRWLGLSRAPRGGGALRSAVRPLPMPRVPLGLPLSAQVQCRSPDTWVLPISGYLPVSGDVPNSALRLA